jgi:hypothetical protein
MQKLQLEKQRTPYQKAKGFAEFGYFLSLAKS